MTSLPTLVVNTVPDASSHAPDDFASLLLPGSASNGGTSPAPVTRVGGNFALDGDLVERHRIQAASSRLQQQQRLHGAVQPRKGMAPVGKPVAHDIAHTAGVLAHLAVANMHEHMAAGASGGGTFQVPMGLDVASSEFSGDPIRPPKPSFKPRVQRHIQGGMPVRVDGQAAAVEPTASGNALVVKSNGPLAQLAEFQAGVSSQPIAGPPMLANSHVGVETRAPAPARGAELNASYIAPSAGHLHRTDLTVAPASPVIHGAATLEPSARTRDMVVPRPRAAPHTASRRVPKHLSARVSAPAAGVGNVAAFTGLSPQMQLGGSIPSALPPMSMDVRLGGKLVRITSAPRANPRITFAPTARGRHVPHHSVGTGVTAQIEAFQPPPAAPRQQAGHGHVPSHGVTLPTTMPAGHKLSAGRPSLPASAVELHVLEAGAQPEHVTRPVYRHPAPPAHGYVWRRGTSITQGQHAGSAVQAPTLAVTAPAHGFVQDTNRDGTQRAHVRAPSAAQAVALTRAAASVGTRHARGGEAGGTNVDVGAGRAPTVASAGGIHGYWRSGTSGRLHGAVDMAGRGFNNSQSLPRSQVPQLPRGALTHTRDSVGGHVVHAPATSQLVAMNPPVMHRTVPADFAHKVLATTPAAYNPTLAAGVVAKALPLRRTEASGQTNTLMHGPIEWPPTQATQARNAAPSAMRRAMPLDDGPMALASEWVKAQSRGANVNRPGRAALGVDRGVGDVRGEVLNGNTRPRIGFMSDEDEGWQSP